MSDDKTMVLERVIDAPVDVIWQAWSDPKALPQWWGPNGYTCKTQRIDLREGGEWLFDMIGPDGTIYPNHHKITRHEREKIIEYGLYAEENGPKHADATIEFVDMGASTKVTLRMVFNSVEEYAGAKAFGAVELGYETLDKLATFIA